MKAPDKLYFDGKSSACEQPIFSSRNIEYLCKDALLEWAEKQIEVYDAHLKDHYDTAWWHEKYAFQQIIDKINSL